MSNKTIPGSLIAQGLSGLNDAKLRNFFKPARFFLIFSTPGFKYAEFGR